MNDEDTLYPVLFSITLKSVDMFTIAQNKCVKLFVKISKL